MLNRRLTSIVAFAVVLFAAQSAFASHYYGASITTRVPNPATPRHIEVVVDMTLRRSYFGPLLLGDTVDPSGSSNSTLVVKTGVTTVKTFAPVTLTVTAVYASQDFFAAEGVFAYDVPGTTAGPYTAEFINCCRQSNLLDLNDETDLRVIHQFTLATGTAVPNNAPIVSVVPFHTLALNTDSSFQLPAVDPDGDTLTYAFASTANSGLNRQEPTPQIYGDLNVSSAGLITWKPLVQGLYGIQFLVSDGHGASVPLELRLSVVDAPLASLPVVRINGSASPVSVPFFVGVQNTFTILATPQDASSSSVVLTSALPSGAIASPSLPANLLSTQTATVTWTPPLSSQKVYIVAVEAMDNTTLQTGTNFIILHKEIADLTYIAGIYRDFASGEGGFGVPDGDNAITLVSPSLGADRKPVFSPSGSATTVTSATAFNNWWNKTNGRVWSLTLSNGGSNDPNVFRFIGSDFGPTFPPASVPDRYFTYEVHSYFTYTQLQQLTFKSSDDLWIFIDGKLAVDLGGVHAVQRTKTFDADTFATAHGLVPGQTYPLDLFYAHRGSTGGHAPQIQLDLNEPVVCNALEFATPEAVPLTRILGRATTISPIATRLIATSDLGPMGGAAWSQTMLPVANGFSVEFDYRVIGTAADGFAFVLQAQGATARGSDGAGLDYAGIDHSIAVEFDSRQDLSNGDPAAAHVGIHTAYAAANSAIESFNIGASYNDPYRPPPKINDAALHHARIEYVPGSLDVPLGTPSLGWIRVFLIGQSDPLNTPYSDLIPFVQSQVDGAKILQAFSSGSAYFGFTASNDTGAPAQVEISNVTMKTPALAPSLSGLVTPPAASGAPATPIAVLLALRDVCRNQLHIGASETVAATSATTDSYTAPVTVTNNHDGTYALSYTPPVGGHWTLGVTINNTPIANSPFDSSISPATATMTATGGSFSYNGLARPAAATVTGVLNESLGPVTFTYGGQPSAIHGGTYNVVASYAGNDHYLPATASTSLTITPVAPTIAATGGTFAYNAQSHPATGTATGVLGEDLGPLTFTYTPNVAAPILIGSYNALGQFTATSDYTAGSASAVVKIDPATPVIHVNDASATYDGDPHGTTATATGVGGEDLSAALVIRYDANSPTAPIDAGSHPVIASLQAAGNYGPASDDGVVTIDKATPTVEVNSATVTYDAHPHGVNGTVKGIGGVAIGSPDAFTYDGNSAQPTNAHAYAVVGTFNGSTNYKPATGNGSLTISAATPTVHVDNASYLFDGQPHPAAGSVTGIGGEMLGPITFTYDGSSNDPVNAKTYQVIGAFAAAGNYRDATGQGTIVISPATPTLVVTAGPFTYDAQPHGATATATGVLGEDLGALSFSYAPGGGEPVNAGTYQVTATLAATSNYASTTASTILTINPATPTVHVNDATATYDGQAHGTTATAIGAGGEDLSAALQLLYDNSASAPVNAGPHPVLATFTAAGNYADASGTGTVTIDKATPIVEVNSSTATYDAQPHGVTGAVKGVGGVTIGSPNSFTYNGNSQQPVNADSYAVVASFGGAANYESATGNGTLTIDKATPHVVVDDAAFTYDGASHVATGIVTGVNNIPLGPLTFTYNGDPAAPSNAGSYAVVGSYASTPNYDAASDAGTMTIAAAAPTLVVTGGTFTYDGSSHVAAGSAKGINGEDLGPLTFTYNGGAVSPMNAGSYAVIGSIAAAGNYAAASKSGASILINKAASHVSWPPPAPIVYGTALSNAQLNATADVAGSFVYSPAAGVLGAGQRLLGVTFTPADTTNYNGSSGAVTLTVDRAPLTITADDKTMSAGSAVPPLTASYNGFVNGDAPASLDTSVALSTSATPASPAGSYSIAANGATDANYIVTHVNGTLTITPMVSIQALISAIGHALDALPVTGNKKNDKAIDDAVNDIADALDPKLWQDATHLSKKGEKAFEKLEDAVESLMAVSPPTPAITQAINSLVALARQLASTSLSDAIAAQGRAQDIARAQLELAAGDSERAEGHFNHAIDEYKEAWHRAEKAVKHLTDADEHGHAHGGHGKDPRHG